MKPGSQSLTTILIRKGLEYFHRYYGTYYGIVKNNEDTQNRNRLILYVPEVFGNSQRYAIADPRGMIAGKDFGFNYMPKLGETVVVTFRSGHPQFPLWEPGFWAQDEKPAEFEHEDIIGFKSRSGHLIMVDDKENIITIKHKDGHLLEIIEDTTTIGKDVKIVINDEYIKLGKDRLEHAVLGDTLKTWLEDTTGYLADALIDTPDGPATGAINVATRTLLETQVQQLDNILAKF